MLIMGELPLYTPNLGENYDRARWNHGRRI